MCTSYMQLSMEKYSAGEVQSWRVKAVKMNKYIAKNFKSSSICDYWGKGTPCLMQAWQGNQLVLYVHETTCFEMLQILYHAMEPGEDVVANASKESHPSFSHLILAPCFLRT